MQREPDDFGPDVEYEGFDAPAGATLGPPIDPTATPEFHIFPNPPREPDTEGDVEDVEADDDYEPEVLRNVTDRTADATKGFKPTPAPRGAASAVHERCMEEPFVGHIRVAELADILGVTHWTMLRLKRSFRGYVDETTAMKEVNRRGG